VRAAAGMAWACIEAVDGWDDWDYLLFVPYFERLCFRPLTPLASNVPRTMW